jgi:hypothetical protein
MAWSGDDGRREAKPREAALSLEIVGARLWPFVLTVFFGILFAGIADLAWLTAIGTTLPWFTSGISAQVYTATLTTATIATLIVASLAASKLALLDARARAVAAREAGEPAIPTPAPVEPSRSVVLAPTRPPRAEGLDSIISELERFAESPLVQVRDRNGASSGGGSSRAGGPPTPLPVGRQKLAPGTREALRRARGLVWQTVAGPLAMFLVFISIAGAMLPGSGAFAQTHYQLNTGLVLFLGYGWPFLVAWTVAAIALLHLLIRPDAFDRMVPNPMPRPNRMH